MRTKWIGASLAGFVLCAGIMGGGLAVAKSGKEPAHRQVTVKLELVNVKSTGEKSTESLAVVADIGQRATSSDTTSKDGLQTDQHAEVTATINKDNTVTLQINYRMMKSGDAGRNMNLTTTITVADNDTRVIKSFAQKTNKETNETLLFVTPSY